MRLKVPTEIVLLALPLLASCSLTPSTSRLAAIEEDFFANKADYVALRDMFVEDGLSVLQIGTPVDAVNEYYHTSGGWFDEDNKPVDFPDVLRSAGLSQERYHRYESLMRTVEVESVSADGSDVSFYIEAFGVLDGYVIQIINTAEDLSEKTVSSVHEIPTEEEGEYFVHLEGNWYLWYLMSY